MESPAAAFSGDGHQVWSSLSSAAFNRYHSALAVSQLHKVYIFCKRFTNLQVLVSHNFGITESGSFTVRGRSLSHTRRRFRNDQWEFGIMSGSALDSLLYR